MNFIARTIEAARNFVFRHRIAREKAIQEYDATLLSSLARNDTKPDYLTEAELNAMAYMSKHGEAIIAEMIAENKAQAATQLLIERIQRNVAKLS